MSNGASQALRCVKIGVVCSKLLRQLTGIRRILAWTLGAALLHAVLAGGIAATPQMYGRVGVSDMQDDLRRYEEYSALLLAGEVPYRDYAIEYPPMALPVFVVPHLGAAVGIKYRYAFVGWMLVVNAATFGLIVWSVMRREGADVLPARLVWLTVATTLLCPLLLMRYDAVPAALAFGAACLWFSNSTVIGGTLIGAGFLMKVFPVVVAIPAFGELVQEHDRRARAGIVACGVVAGLGLALWLALGGQGAVSSIRYHYERGLEIGSIYAGIAMTVEKAAGRMCAIDYLHSSLELTTPWTVALAKVALPIQAAALVGVAIRPIYTQSRKPLHDAAAAVVAFLTFGKVLSPQYVIWALPFIAALPGRTGRRARLIFLFICGLTTMIYPWQFDRLYGQVWWAIALLNLRNSLLVALYVVLLRSGHAPCNDEVGTTSSRAGPATKSRERRSVS